MGRVFIVIKGSCAGSGTVSAKRGIKELGLPPAEIARHLGVSTSSVSRAW